MARRQSKYGPYNYERILGTRNYQFSAEVSEFVAATQKRITALGRQSIIELINEAQTPVAKGGRMRVDTGFLRASGALSLSGMPSGPERGDPDKKYSTAPVAQVELAGWQPGQTIWFGWTANYAKYREAYDGFLFAAVQNWQAIVNRVSARILAKSTAQSTRGNP
jgi:hypothetical protein